MFIAKDEKIKNKLELIKNNIINSIKMAEILNDFWKTEINFIDLLIKMKNVGLGLDDIDIDDIYIKTSYFEDNGYIKNIKLDNIKYKDYKFCKYVIKQESVFGVDIIIQENMKKISIIKSFEASDYYFYSLQNNNKEWMSLAPFELYTQDIYLDKMTNNVMIIGIGMGYFAYMCSLKKDVKKITLVDNDKDVIELFEKELLPQFQYKDKIEIIYNDGEKVFNDALNTYDAIYVDVWLAPSDREGIPIYMNFKRMELTNKNKKATVCYWLEDEIMYGLKSKFWSYIFYNFEERYEEMKERFLQTPIMPDLLLMIFKNKPDFRDFESIIKFENILKNRNIEKINTYEELQYLENSLDNLVQECILHENIKPLVELTLKGR